MAKREYSAYALSVAKFRDRENRINLSSMGGMKIDFLALVHSFLSDVHADPIRGDRFYQYFAVNEVALGGRSLRFSAEYGKYGVSGFMRDVKSNEVTHAYGDNESATVPLRNMVIVPSKGNFALLLVERYGGRGVASMFLHHLKASFRRKFQEHKLVLHSEGLTNAEAWKEYEERANLKKIHVVQYEPSHDIADGIAASEVGSLAHTLSPPRGVGSLSKHMYRRLMNKEINAADMLGLRDNFSSSETRLELDDGEQQRSVIIENDSIPTLAYPIKEKKGEELSDNEVYALMAKTGEEICRTLGVSLPHDWRGGSQVLERAGASMGVVREI